MKASYAPYNSEFPPCFVYPHSPFRFPLWSLVSSSPRQSLNPEYFFCIWITRLSFRNKMAAATASFTFPPHPSATKIHGPASILPTASGPYAALKIDTDTAGIATPLTPSSHKEHEGRNPHDLPSFTSEGLAHPSSPVLYLPPLLSKLPPKYPDFDPFPSSSSLSPSSSSPSSSFPLSSPTQLPSALITETRLPDIDPASLSLHKALHKFRPIDSNYAGTPYAEAFNWSELELSEDEEREWYVVAFRSKRKAGSDGEREYDFHMIMICEEVIAHLIFDFA